MDNYIPSTAFVYLIIKQSSALIVFIVIKKKVNLSGHFFS